MHDNIVDLGPISKVVQRILIITRASVIPKHCKVHTTWIPK